MARDLRSKPTDAANQTFQVSSHGVGPLKPFLRNIDKREFLGRLSWYLSPTVTRDAKRRPYAQLFEEVAVLAYCVLDNHFHLVVHQYTADGMQKLMSRVLSGYGKYYNREHNWRGPIFDARYAADPLESPDHMKEMLGYVILNDPIQQLGNEYCSNAIHIGERNSHWVRNDLALNVFGGIEGYRALMNRTGPARVESKLKRWGVDPTLHPYRPI